VVFDDVNADPVNYDELWPEDLFSPPPPPASGDPTTPGTTEGGL
jgi:hypothetical protein